MRGVFFVGMLLFLGCSDFEETAFVVYLIGDSTMSEKAADKRPETGWGEMLPLFFDEKIQFENHAKNGRSTKSFITENRWEAVFKKLKKGDYVLIQFGHNDFKKDTARYSSPAAYQKNLTRFVTDARAKGANPILLTPVVRRRFDESENFFRTHGAYPAAVKSAAEKLKVPMIDLRQKSEELLIEFGEARSKELFLWVEKGAHENYPEGKEDDTHFSPKGAKEIARLAAEEIAKSDSDLKKYLR